MKRLRLGIPALAGAVLSMVGGLATSADAANRAFVYAPNTRGRNYLGFRVAKTLK